MFFCAPLTAPPAQRVRVCTQRQRQRQRQKDREKERQRQTRCTPDTLLTSATHTTHTHRRGARSRELRHLHVVWDRAVCPRFLPQSCKRERVSARRGRRWERSLRSGKKGRGESCSETQGELHAV
eukprot:49874-Rhodomonas_salina.1